jgi:hypothetical protein
VFGEWLSDVEGAFRMISLIAMLVMVAPKAIPREPDPAYMFDTKSKVSWDCEVRDPSGNVSNVSGTTGNFVKLKDDYDVHTPDFTAESNIKFEKNSLLSGELKTYFFTYDSRFIVVAQDRQSYPFTRHSLNLRFRGRTLPYPEKIDQATIEVSKTYESGTSYTSTVGLGYCTILGFQLTPYRNEKAK